METEHSLLLETSSVQGFEQSQPDPSKMRDMKKNPEEKLDIYVSPKTHKHRHKDTHTTYTHKHAYHIHTYTHANMHIHTHTNTHTT